MSAPTTTYTTSSSMKGIGSMSADDARAVAESLGRHVSLHSVCANLHSMIVGARAAEILAEKGSLPSKSGLFVAPSWMWAYPRIPVGHKGINSDGEAVRLPIRVTWDTTPVGIVMEPGVTASWQSNGMGHSGVGITQVTLAPRNALLETALESNSVPAESSVATLNKRELVHALNELVSTGKDAQWALMLQLEPFVVQAVNTAHAYVSAEVSPNGQPVLDATGREQIVSSIMYGDPDKETGESIVLNMLGRCQLDTTFVNVDPWMYMRKTISSAAESAIRRKIRDPHIGRKIRRLSEELGTRDVEIVMAEYNKRYPKDRLARKRAENALNAGSDAMAVWVGIPEVVPREEAI